MAGNFKFRLIAGAWCMTALILTTAYSSVLTAFIMAPHYKPLVDSVQELASRTDVQLVVQSAWAIDLTITVC